MEIFIHKLKEKISSEDLRRALNHALVLFADKNKTDMKMLELIVDAGADDFNNLLLHAVHVGNMETVKFAVDNGADNLAEAFLQAVHAEHSSTIKFLLDLLQRQDGEVVNEKVNQVAQRAFSRALANDNTDLAKFLVRKKAVSLDIATMLTIGAEHEKMLEYVAQKGVNDPTSWNTSTWALQHAATYGWKKTLEIILTELKHNPDDALLRASTYGHEEIVRFILQIGVSVDSLSAARDLARLYDNEDIDQLLTDEIGSLTPLEL